QEGSGQRTTPISSCSPVLRVTLPRWVYMLVALPLRCLGRRHQAAQAGNGFADILDRIAPSVLGKRAVVMILEASANASLVGIIGALLQRGDAALPGGLPVVVPVRDAGEKA